MKARLLLFAALATTFPACDRKPQRDPETVLRESQETLDNVKRQLAEMQEKDRQREQQATAAQVDQERQALAAERAKLEQDRAQLDDQQRRAADQRLAQIREEQRANEKRAEENERLAAQKQEQQRRAEERAAADEARTAQQPARGDQTLDFFYDALDPQGDWVELERYGYCWQPSVARNPGWRPYLDGHWVYTNYGWTWASQEPFGWATYHYGRWTRVRGLGWVWVPGSEWAPAWVSWRRSDRYVGWAPLPPEAHSGSGFNAGVDSYYDIGPGTYNFVEVETMGAPTYMGRVVEPAQNITVINQTTNVTNVIYRQVDNRTVLFNDGPQFAEIERHSPVRRMELERVNKAPAASESRGNVLQLLAPFIVSAAKPAGQPSRVREHLRGAEVERGWSGDDAATVTRVREQQKLEAKKAEQAQREPARAIPAAKVEPAAVLPAATPRPAAPRKIAPTPAPVFVEPPTATATPSEKPKRPRDVPPLRAPATPSPEPMAATPRPPKLAPPKPAPALDPAATPIPAELPKAPRNRPEIPAPPAPAERPPNTPRPLTPKLPVEPAARSNLREPGALPKPPANRPAKATPVPGATPAEPPR